MCNMCVCNVCVFLCVCLFVSSSASLIKLFLYGKHLHILLRLLRYFVPRLNSILMIVVKFLKVLNLGNNWFRSSFKLPTFTQKSESLFLSVDALYSSAVNAQPAFSGQ